MRIDKLKDLKLTAEEADLLRAMTSGPLHTKHVKERSLEIARALESRGFIDQYAPASLRINQLGTDVVFAYQLTANEAHEHAEAIERSDDNEDAASRERDLHVRALLACVLRCEDPVLAEIAFEAWRTTSMHFRRG